MKKSIIHRNFHFVVIAIIILVISLSANGQQNVEEEIDCGKNDKNGFMEFNSCGSPKGCEDTCDQLMGRAPIPMCAAVCEPRCMCPRGTFQHGNDCLTAKECRQTTISIGEEAYTTTDELLPKPENPVVVEEEEKEEEEKKNIRRGDNINIDKTPELADELPIKAKPELILDPNLDVPVPVIVVEETKNNEQEEEETEVIVVPEVQECEKNQIYNECHIPETCDRSCENLLGLGDPIICVKKCVSRCGCPVDMASVNGMCLSLSDCRSYVSSTSQSQQETVELSNIDLTDAEELAGGKKMNKKMKKKMKKKAKKQSKKMGTTFGLKP